MIDEERTYSAGDIFIVGDKYYSPRYGIVHAGGNVMWVIRPRTDAWWIVRDVSDINAVTYAELKKAIGKYIDRMDNYDRQ